MMLAKTLFLLALVSFARSQWNKAKKERDQCLSAHNKLRALHSDTGPMTWDAKLAAGAKTWATKLANEGTLVHSEPDGEYGENLFSATGQSASCAKATLKWYNEISDYDFNNPGFSKGTGHFTQVVWKASTKLGVGIASNGNRIVVVARYAPPGNYRGQYEVNVLEQKSGAKVPTLEELESNGSTEKPGTNTTTAGCVDKSKRCSKIDQKKCKGGWARNRCPKTCNSCKKPTTTTTSACEDKAKKCSKIKETRCKGGWAKKRCPKTCKICTQPETADDEYETKRKQPKLTDQ